MKGQRYSVCCASLLGLCFLTEAACADDAACQKVLDALDRTIETPSHQYIARTSASTGGKPRLSESINTGKARYIQVDGQWRVSKMTNQDVRQQSDENRASSKFTCRFERDEIIDDVAASLYAFHSDNDDAASDTKVWIAKSTGLPVHEIIDIDVGAGAAGKTHHEVRFVYAGVQAPTVVQR